VEALIHPYQIENCLWNSNDEDYVDIKKRTQALDLHRPEARKQVQPRYVNAVCVDGY